YAVFRTSRASRTVSSDISLWRGSGEAKTGHLEPNRGFDHFTSTLLKNIAKQYKGEILPCGVSFSSSSFCGAVEWPPLRPKLRIRNPTWLHWTRRNRPPPMTSSAPVPFWSHSERPRQCRHSV